MRYRIEYADGYCCNYANGSKEVLEWLRLLKDENIIDIRKIYKNGESVSVMGVYQKYIKQAIKATPKEQGKAEEKYFIEFENEKTRVIIAADLTAQQADKIIKQKRQKTYYHKRKMKELFLGLPWR